MEFNLKYIIILSITTVIIASLTIWGSFAFFAIEKNSTNELTVNITIGSTGDDVTFTSSLNAAASLNVTSDSMLYGNAGTGANQIIISDSFATSGKINEAGLSGTWYGSDGTAYTGTTIPTTSGGTYYKVNPTI